MLQHKENNSVVLVLPEKVSGDNADLFVGSVQECITVNSSDHIIVDCSDMELFTSSHIKLLYHAEKLCKKANVHLRLKMGHRGLVDPIKVLSTDDYWAASLTIGQSENMDTESEKTSSSEGISYVELNLTDSEVERACLQLHEHLLTFNLDRQTHYSTRTLYYEMLNNIHLHSEIMPHEIVTVKVIVNNTTITMVFTHGGMRFDLNEQMTGPHMCTYSDEERLSFGIFMIKKLSDEIKYERTEEEENITTLIIRRDNKVNQINILRDSKEEGLIAIQLGKILDNRNVHELAKILKRAHDESYKSILIDFSKLEFLSSAGVGVIVSKNRMVRSNGGQIVLFNVPDTVIFVLTELDVVDLLNIRSDLDTYLSRV